MEDQNIVIERRFHGPANSGNGGYVCGRLARHVDGTAKVRLRLPPPLEKTLEVRRSEDAVLLLDGESVIAEARSGELDMEVPEPPSVEEADQASRNFPGFRSHRFPSCFVCGPERMEGDGLRIFAGPVPRRGIVACTWTPAADLANDLSNDQAEERVKDRIVNDRVVEDRIVRSEFVWAVLDCPGGFAFPEPREGTVVLGELAARITVPVYIGNRYIVAGWEISREGRKHRTGTALFTDTGNCCAYACGTWIEVTGF